MFIGLQNVLYNFSIMSRIHIMTFGQDLHEETKDIRAEKTRIPIVDTKTTQRGKSFLTKQKDDNLGKLLFFIYAKFDHVYI